MSRKIDRTNLDSLSQDDLIYLRDRGQLSATEEATYLGDVKVSAPEDIPLSDRPNTGDVGTTTAQGKPDGGTPPDEETLAEEGLAPEDYEDAKKDELKEELRVRDIPFTNKMTHDELVELLEEDDLENEDGEAE